MKSARVPETLESLTEAGKASAQSGVTDTVDALYQLISNERRDCFYDLHKDETQSVGSLMSSSHGYSIHALYHMPQNAVTCTTPPNAMHQSLHVLSYAQTMETLISTIRDVHRQPDNGSANLAPSFG